jgi:hypothetical protein
MGRKRMVRLDIRPRPGRELSRSRDTVPRDFRFPTCGFSAKLAAMRIAMSETRPQGAGAVIEDEGIIFDFRVKVVNFTSAGS